MAVIEETDHNGCRLREFTVAAHGREVHGVIWLPAAPTSGAPLVCFGHGASGDRHQQPIPWIAKKLVTEHGCFALSIDGPVHGRRKVGDGARGAFWPEWGRQGTVEDMNADWLVALDFAQSQAEVGQGPVGYWGLSMGTIYGAPFVAAEPRIQVAVLGLMGITGPDHYRPTITAAAEAIDVPLLFLMQLEDELFDRSECLALFDAFGSTNKRLHASPGLHPEVPVEELHASIDFLVTGLGGAGPSEQSMFSVSS